MKPALALSVVGLLLPTGAAFADDKGADLKLAKRILEGGVGVWGSVPMPAQPQVTEAEALTLSRWILDLK